MKPKSRYLHHQHKSCHLPLQLRLLLSAAFAPIRNRFRVSNRREVSALSYTRRMRTIGLFLGTTEDSYGKAVVRGVLQGVRGTGTRLVCFTTGSLRSSHGYEAQRNVLFDLVDDQSVDALILAGALSHNVSNEELETFCRRYAPLPLVTLSVSLPGLPSVVTDDRAGFASVVDHLIGHHGYTRLAFVGGPSGQQEAETRRTVFLERMAAAGLKVDPAWVVQGDYTRYSGVDAGARLWKTLEGSNRPRFQAVVAANDSMALGVEESLKSKGWRFPQDCAVTGFDDLPESRVQQPPLTTVFQSAQALSEEAARVVLKLLDGRTVPPVTAIVPTLQVRTSCGCPPRSQAGQTKQDYERALAACEDDLSQEAREGAVLLQLMDRLRGTTENMLTSHSFPNLLEVLEENLVHMGYQGFWLSLFEDSSRPSISSRLHLSRSPDGIVLSTAQGRPFPSRQLIPGGLDSLDEGTDLLVVEALYSRNFRMGFIVFATDQGGSQITGTLRGQISGALQAVLLLEERKQAERQLIQSEKMAALGSLVAGVAHEINTPLGVAITASSFLTDQTSQFQAKLKTASVSKSELEGLLEDLRQAGASIQANLERAADLVASFKQVSADQTSEQRREFALGEYLRETLLSLQFQWKKREIEVELESGPDPVLDSYPGALVQVITNLVSNSLLHGFPAGQKGRISLGLEDRGTAVLLWYADDGAGIPYHHQKQIFDPFFTTKRGHGGTGLGLHIVFNIVTNILGGTITFASTPGTGTRFEMILPKKAPETGPPQP